MNGWLASHSLSRKVADSRLKDLLNPLDLRLSASGIESHG